MGSVAGFTKPKTMRCVLLWFWCVHNQTKTTVDMIDQTNGAKESYNEEDLQADGQEP